MNRFQFTLPKPVGAHLKLTAFALHGSVLQAPNMILFQVKSWKP